VEGDRSVLLDEIAVVWYEDLGWTTWTNDHAAGGVKLETKSWGVGGGGIIGEK
jgi:hypothetical protein